MADGIWAAAGIRVPALSAKERDHLALLRVSLLATKPTEEKLCARRADVAVLLAAVDRLAQGPAVESVAVVRRATVGSFFAGTMRVVQGDFRLQLGRRRRTRSTAGGDIDDRAT
jgi:hypothetical protein